MPGRRPHRYPILLFGAQALFPPPGHLQGGGTGQPGHPTCFFLVLLRAEWLTLGGSGRKALQIVKASLGQHSAILSAFKA